MAMTAQGDSQEGDYLLGHTEREAERLRRAAQAHEQYVETLFDQIGLAPGMTCLDVGSGTGADMELMGRRVGTTGKVVGLDINADQGREVAARLNQTGTSEYVFVEGDVNTIDTLPTARHDVTYARFLLSLQRDPIEVIRRMWNWTRKGGCLALIDVDFRSMGVFPPSAAMAEVRRVIYELYTQTGRDPELGGKLPEYVDRACGGPPSRINVWAEAGSLHEGRYFVEEFYRSITPAALRLGVTTAENVEAFHAEVDDLSEGSPYVVYNLTVGTWKRKE
jgi:ubiquinone/menaquinone biosynthesis C-methylase UbiE